MNIDLKETERTKCEIWTNIKGYNGKYLISNYGEVLNYNRDSGQIRRQGQRKRGGRYLETELWKDG